MGSLLRTRGCTLKKFPHGRWSKLEDVPLRNSHTEDGQNAGPSLSTPYIKDHITTVARKGSYFEDPPHRFTAFVLQACEWASNTDNNLGPSRGIHQVDHVDNVVSKVLSWCFPQAKAHETLSRHVKHCHNCCVRSSISLSHHRNQNSQRNRNVTPM